MSENSNHSKYAERKREWYRRHSMALKLKRDMGISFEEAKRISESMQDNSE